MSTFVANGDIQPSRFVTPVHGAEHRVAQSVEGDCPIGISNEAQRAAPGLGGSTVAATTDQSLAVYTEGQECLLQAGVSGWSAGDYIAPDNTGAGNTIAVTADDQIGARALENANPGELGRVMVMIRPGA